MNGRGARILIVDSPRQRIFEEYVDPTDVSAGLPGMAQAVQAMKDTLPPIVRRTPRERYESMLNRVLPDMLRAYRNTGQMPEWPASLQSVLAYVAERDHDPDLIKPGGVEKVIEQGKALVGYLMDTGVRQQAESDGKKVTLSWAGH